MGLLATAVARLFSPRYLPITNTVSYGVLMTAGDVAVQGIERRLARSRGERGSSYNWQRSGESEHSPSFHSLSVSRCVRPRVTTLPWREPTVVLNTRPIINSRPIIGGHVNIKKE